MASRRRRYAGVLVLIFRQKNDLKIRSQGLVLPLTSVPVLLFQPPIRGLRLVMEQSPNSKHRAYVFVLNNWTDEELYQIKQLKYKYIIIGDEHAPTTGTPHLQGYVSFKNPISWNSLKSVIPRARIAPAKGTAEHNQVYSSKEKVLFEDGEPPKQGKRTDLQNIKEYITQTPNPNMRDVCLNIATNYQSIRTAEVMLKYLEPKRDPAIAPQVLWYCGPTGTGKTRKAHEENPDAYVKDNSNKWWCGYDQHECVIIDDMRYNTFDYHKLLTLTDRYPNQVECKGGNRQMVAKKIIITSPFTPEEMFADRVHEDLGQFTRRITEIKIFT